MLGAPHHSLHKTSEPPRWVPNAGWCQSARLGRRAKIKLPATTGWITAMSTARAAFVLVGPGKIKLPLVGHLQKSLRNVRFVDPLRLGRDSDWTGYRVDARLMVGRNTISR